MSGRCVCCNRVLLRTTGKRKLPDGNLVEETFCNTCRHEVDKILRDSYYNSVDNNNNTKFEGIVEQQMFYGCLVACGKTFKLVQVLINSSSSRGRRILQLLDL